MHERAFQMAESSMANARDQAPVRTSEILSSLASSHSGRVPLKTILTAMGSRMHGVALVILALPDTWPLPLPSTSTVLGIPLVLIAAHLVMYGEESRLPARAEAISVSPAVLRMLARYAGPVLRILERISRPRWSGFLRSDRALGLLCLYLSVLLLLPLPFLNVAPALCLVAIAFGMVHRDGAIVALGVFGAFLLTVALGFLADWIRVFVAPIIW